MCNKRVCMCHTANRNDYFCSTACSQAHRAAPCLFCGFSCRQCRCLFSGHHARARSRMCTCHPPLFPSYFKPNFRADFRARLSAGFAADGGAYFPCFFPGFLQRSASFGDLLADNEPFGTPKLGTNGAPN